MSDPWVMDRTAIDTLIDRIIADRAGTVTIGLLYIGNRLGIFRAMAGAGPVTSGELAERAGLNERYVLEWLKAMVAAEYLECDPTATKFQMTEEQAAVLADDESPTYLGGAGQLPIGSILHMPRFLEVFRDGGGLSYEELGPDIAEAHDQSHKSMFQHLLTQTWLPRVPGLQARLEAGIAVLDVGCGKGRSSLTMARAYPKSRIDGLDFDPYSISQARRAATEAGIGNVAYLEMSITDLPAEGAYGFVLAFDCIHDMADPVGALKAIRGGLAEDGLFVWSELRASDNPLENRNPVGKMISGISPFHCLTVSLAQGGVGLGNLLGEPGVRGLAEEAGFSTVEPLPIANRMQQFFLLRR